MAGDYSRRSFDALSDFSGVLLQQGRAVLDADWNEMVRIFERRIRAECVDTIGRAVVPRETPLGFEIRLTQAGGLEIGRGRKYLDGMLLECHGQAEFDGTPQPGIDPPVFDRARPGDDGPTGVLDELISPASGDFLPIEAQPYWPNAVGLPQAAPGGNQPGPHIAYLVAWQREVTPFLDAGLLDPALGGIDTATRLQTVWQVRLLAVPQGTVCETPDGQIEAWADLIRPSAARLSVDTIDIEDPEDPCLVPPSDGYVGRENQNYRVEVHDITDEDVVRIKFSRENASVLASVVAIESPADRVTVASIGRDEKLSFRAGDWVEITDDHREFDHQPGRMLRILQVIEETREIVFDRAIDEGLVGGDLIPTGLGGDTPAARHTRLIRWDQRGRITLAAGGEVIDLENADTDGLIPLPGDGAAIHLEAGITVALSLEGPGVARPLDWWSFHARTAGTQVERLVNAPPHGIQRHHCRLAVVDPATSFVDDCRVFWPDFEGGDAAESCGCTVCVTPEGHNSGALTIQAAINQVGQDGGTVCLEAGPYLLGTPVVISGRNAIRLTGQGVGTSLTYRGTGAAIRISTGTDISLDRFTLLVLPGEDAAGNLPPSHGVTALDTSALVLSRLAISVVAGDPEGRIDHAIALDGAQLGTVIENCVALAAIAVGARASFEETAELEQDAPAFVALAEMRVRDCTLLGGRDAVRFDRVAFNLAGAAFTGNLVLAGGTGMRLNWAEAPAAGTLIEGSTVIGGSAGMLLGVTDARVTECEVTAGAETGVGIRTVPNILPDAVTDLRVTGTGIADLGGAGIRLAGRHGAVLLKQNVIRRCVGAGIAVAPEAQIDHLSVDNNHIEEIAATRGALGAAAISVAGAASAHVAANAIRGVGRIGRNGERYVGIAVQGVARLSILDNALSEIGPDSPEVVAIGIALRRPYGEVALRGNRIEARPAGEAIAAWAAVEIGTPFEDIQPPDDDTPGLPAPASTDFTTLPGAAPDAVVYLSFAEETLRLSPTGLSAAAIPQQTTIALTGSQITAGLGLLRPAVTIHDGGAIALDVSHNQISQTGREALPAAVFLTARRINAASNTVLHGGELFSMSLETGPDGAATPLGNITSGRIVLNGGGVPQPFAALNLLT